jgi:lipopolysaccharide transport system permease protein
MQCGEHKMTSRNTGVASYKIAAGYSWFVDIAELIRYRHLVLLLAWRGVQVRYKQTVLGLLWALVTPVAFTLIFVLFFRLVPVKPSDNIPYVPATFAGMILWQLFSRGATEAGTSLSANANLITKVYFPRVTLPIAAAMSALVDFFVTAVLLAAILAWYQIPFTLSLLVAPVFVLQVFVLSTALGMLLAAIDGLFRDLRHAVPLLMQLGMFISPVAYTTNALVPRNWQWLYMLNPMVAPIEGFRWALLPGAVAPGITEIAVSLLVTLALVATGSVFFARVEHKIVDMV